MKLPEPFKDSDGTWHYKIAPNFEIFIEKTGGYGKFIPRAQRWTISILGPVYICQCLPTRKACIAAIPRLLRAMP